MRRAAPIGGSVLLAVGLLWYVRSREASSQASGTAGGSPIVDGAPERAEGVASEPAPERGLEETAAAAARTPLPTTAASSPGSGPLHLRLVDAETSEPIPDYELELRDEEGERWSNKSDAEGRVVTRALPAGHFGIRCIDVRRPDTLVLSPSLPVEHDGGEAEHELRLEIGPTYVLDVTPSDFSAGELVAELLQDSPEFSNLHRLPQPTTVVRPPRSEGGAPWVRFRSPNTLADPAWLALTSQDGLRSGGARVPARLGVHPELVRIALAPRCAVRGQFVSRGAPNERGAGGLAVFRRDEEGGEPHWENTDGQGHFRIADLAPGAYRLELRDQAVRATPVDFELVGG
jgi:hypothetical protein